MDAKITWYVARSSGLVTWALILMTIVWGLLLATRALGSRPTPAWLLSLHRYLGALALVFLGVHVGAILLDSYTDFSVVNVLVPFTSSWDPLAVAWGIVRDVPARGDRDHVTAAQPHVATGVACGASARLLPLRHQHGAHADGRHRREGGRGVERRGPRRHRGGVRIGRDVHVAARRRASGDRTRRDRRRETVDTTPRQPSMHPPMNSEAITMKVGAKS